MAQPGPVGRSPKLQASARDPTPGTGRHCLAREGLVPGLPQWWAEAATEASSKGQHGTSSAPAPGVFSGGSKSGPGSPVWAEHLTHSVLGSSGNCKLPKVSGRSRMMEEDAEVTRREPGQGGQVPQGFSP